MEAWSQATRSNLKCSTYINGLEYLQVYTDWTKCAPLALRNPVRPLVFTGLLRGRQEVTLLISQVFYVLIFSNYEQQPWRRAGGSGSGLCREGAFNIFLAPWSRGQALPTMTAICLSCKVPTGKPPNQELCSNLGSLKNLCDYVPVVLPFPSLPTWLFIRPLYVQNLATWWFLVFLILYASSTQN